VDANQRPSVWKAGYQQDKPLFFSRIRALLTSAANIRTQVLCFLGAMAGSLSRHEHPIVVGFNRSRIATGLPRQVPQR